MSEPSTRIYFIQPVDGGLIKIGKADDPVKRLRDLQIGCPVRLRLCKHYEAEAFMERRLHLMFAAWREHGEWFRPHPALAALAAAQPDPSLENEPIDLTGVDFCKDVREWLARRNLPIVQPCELPARDPADPRRWEHRHEPITAYPRDMDPVEQWRQSSADAA